MTASPLMSSEVEVAVDPSTAFAAFTDEMDLWWVRTPITFHDSARTVAKRCEPGVGGRLLEVYDEATGEALELARITVWEPGARLAWQSSVDDVEIDVRFEPTAAGGTRVVVAAQLAEGGQDRGGTAWVRVTPAWFGRWCARRDTAPRTPQDLDRLALEVRYAKPATAARWLASAFGFDPMGDLPSDDGKDHWIEFHLGHCALMVRRQGDDVPEQVPTTHLPWVFVDDLDAHYAQAEANGATIVEPIHQYGYRAYVATDLEGHRWTFAQARPTMRL
jgi:uncharacterized glyoxalase superfamily protein PhnB